MTNDDIKRAFEAGNQTAIAKAFKFDQATALIRKLLKVEGETADIKIQLKRDGSVVYITIDSNDLFEEFGACGRQIWAHIRLGDFGSFFIDKDTPDKARVLIRLDWWYERLDGGRNGMKFADLLFDFGARPNEWQARMANGTFVTLD